MKEFFKVKTVREVLSLIDAFGPVEPEEIDLASAGGRVAAEDVQAAVDVPDFSRSTMDGFAVRAKDTFGSSESLPGLFGLVGEVLMGRAPDFEVGPGQAARVWTGGMMPRGSDAVVMVEYSRLVDEATVELARPAAPFEHVVRPGEDVKKGEVLAPRGRRLRPQDLGLLASLGYDRVRVYRKPVAALLSTGDEIVPAGETPGPGQVRDVNTYTLGAMLENDGAEVVRLGLVRDDLERLRDRVAEGLDRADAVLISGGSSVGARDFTVSAFRSFPGTEILVHGVSVSPGKPTIMARRGNQSLWGLPGHTVSAMITAGLFVRPLLSRLSGEALPRSWQKPVPAVLARSVASVHGRQDFIRVRLEESDEVLIAHPIIGKSALISTMVKADGLICIPMNDEGLAKGAHVDVTLFD